MAPVPLLFIVSGVTVSFPAPAKHAQCLLVSLPSPSISFCSLWVFMRFAMTFHLGGPDIKALLFLELEKQMTLPLGRMCPEGAVKVQYY